MPRAGQGQNGLKSPYFGVSRPWGSGRAKRKKVTENHPESVVTFFFNFGTPVALGPAKGPQGLVACLLLACCLLAACLLLARRAGFTLVPE